MLTKQPIRKIADYANRFVGPQLEMVVASIAAGNTAAQLWVSSTTNSDPTLLLWDKGNNVLYLSAAQPALSEETVQALTSLLSEQIRPQALIADKVYFSVSVLPPLPRNAAPKPFSTIAPHQIDKLFFRFTEPHPVLVSMPDVDDLQFAPIDRNLLTNTQLANAAEVRGEIGQMWPTEEHFWCHGFGVAALVPEQTSGRIVCWCTAEYVSASQCGIGIATNPAYRQRGIATATADRFVREALRRGMTPHWETAAVNIASRRVAEKLGFTLLEERVVWAGKWGRE
jgi:RimJ/RimL family protein N-acetyltransferase